MTHRRLISAGLLIVGGWALSLALSTFVKTRAAMLALIGLERYGGWLLAYQISPWPVGALFTGLGLMILLRPVRWYHAMLMSVAWALSAPINWPLAMPIAALKYLTITSYRMHGPHDTRIPSIAVGVRHISLDWLRLHGIANWSVGLIAAGLVAAVVLRFATRRITLGHAAAISAGWIAARMLAFGIPQAATGQEARIFEMVTNIPLAVGQNALHGALFGLVGGGLMLAVLWVLVPDAAEPLPPALPLPRRALQAHLAGARPGERGLRRALIGGGLLFAAGLGSGLTIGETAPFVTLAMIIGPLVLVNLMVPLVVGVGAALITADHARRDPFVLLRLADLPPGEIVRGFVTATLIRLRWLLAASLGLMSFLSAIFYLRLYRYRGAIRWPIPSPVGFWTSALMIIVGTLGVSLLAAALGVGLGLAARRVPPLGAALTPVLVTAYTVSTLATVIGGARTTRSAWLAESAAMIGFAVLPYLLSRAVMELAGHIVWPSERAILAWERAS